MSALLEPGAADRRGQEWGVEGNCIVPPATNSSLNNLQAHAEVCNNIETGRDALQVRVCALQAGEYCHDDEKCKNPAVDESDFCAEHVGEKLCKTSNIQYQSDGNSFGCFVFVHTMPPHPVDFYEERTKRAQFCSDRCRNLWRDTKQSRERQIEVRKLENGERSERYALISNYQNTGLKVICDKVTGRIVG